MIRTHLATLAQGVAIALSIALVIAFAAIGCIMNKRESYTAHNVKGFRAPIVSSVSPY
jgi:hypothetical protein